MEGAPKFRGIDKVVDGTIADLEGALALVDQESAGKASEHLVYLDELDPLKKYAESAGSRVEPLVKRILQMPEEAQGALAEVISRTSESPLIFKGTDDINDESAAELLLPLIETAGYQGKKEAAERLLSYLQRLGY